MIRVPRVSNPALGIRDGLFALRRFEFAKSVSAELDSTVMIIAGPDRLSLVDAIRHARICKTVAEQKTTPSEVSEKVNAANHRCLK